MEEREIEMPKSNKSVNHRTVIDKKAEKVNIGSMKKGSFSIAQGMQETFAAYPGKRTCADCAAHPDVKEVREADI